MHWSVNLTLCAIEAVDRVTVEISRLFNPGTLRGELIISHEVAVYRSSLPLELLAYLPMVHWGGESHDWRAKFLRLVRVLMSSDVAAAKAFYANVVGWSTEDMAMARMTYTILRIGDTQVGEGDDAAQGGVRRGDEALLDQLHRRRRC